MYLFKKHPCLFFHYFSIYYFSPQMQSSQFSHHQSTRSCTTLHHTLSLPHLLPFLVCQIYHLFSRVSLTDCLCLILGLVSLDSTYKRNHPVFTFLLLVHLPQTNTSCTHIAANSMSLSFFLVTEQCSIMYHIFLIY